MEDVDIPADRLQDPARLRSIGRDPERTPMQWDSSPGRGFTTGEPWLPFGSPEISVAAQDRDPASMLSLVRRAIWTRKREPALHSGAFTLLDAPPDVVAFLRSAPGARDIVCAINMATEPARIELPAGIETVLLSTDPELDGAKGGSWFELGPLAGAWFTSG